MMYATKLPDGFYWLKRPDEPSPFLVRLYTPCHPETRGIGFGAWDGGAFMSLSQVSKSWVLTPAEMIHPFESDFKGLSDLLSMKVKSEGQFGEVEISPEFRVSVQEIDKDRGVRIIIHPMGYNGDTLDYWVKGNKLTQI